MIKMKKALAKLGLVGALALTLVVVTACADNGDSSDGGADENGNLDHLIVGIAIEARTLDLHRTNDVGSSQVSRQIFETLVFQDDDMAIIPGLAHHWELYNDRVWEFHLNEGVYFHNGQPLTAYDVAATFERAAESPHIAAILGMIDVSTIEVVDDLTIRVGTEEPFAPFLSHLAHAAAGIMNAEDLANAEEPEDPEVLDTDLDRHPNGTGPFMVVDAREWVSGDQIQLHRFDDYHATIPGRDLPSFSQMTIRFIGEANARMVALEAGEIHIDLTPTAENFARVENTEGLRLESAAGLRTEYLGMNVEQEYLSNPLVRQAINYATDVQAIIDAIYQGHGAAGQSHLSANVFGYNPDIEGFPFDVERARELMAEAGFEDGFSVTLHANTERQDRVDIAQILEQQLREINIDITIATFTWPELLNILDAGEADMFLIGWTSVTGDGDYGLFPLFHSSQHGSAGNFTRYNNPEVDALLEAARISTVTEDRLAYYHRILEILRDDTPWVVMLQEEPSAFVNYDIVLDGFSINPVGTHYLGDITLGSE